MKEFGYRQVQVWLDADELAVINQAAAQLGKRLATFLREQSFHAAAAILGKPGPLLARSRLAE